MSDEALFDLTPEQKDTRVGPYVTHVLMPCMAYACGASILTHRGTFLVGADERDWHHVTCTGCRSVGLSTIRSEIARQQRSQAGAA